MRWGLGLGGKDAAVAVIPLASDHCGCFKSSCMRAFPAKARAYIAAPAGVYLVASSRRSSGQSGCFSGTAAWKASSSDSASVTRLIVGYFERSTLNLGGDGSGGGGSQQRDARRWPPVAAACGRKGCVHDKTELRVPLGVEHLRHKADVHQCHL